MDSVFAAHFPVPRQTHDTRPSRVDTSAFDLPKISDWSLFINYNRIKSLNHPSRKTAPAGHPGTRNLYTCSRAFAQKISPKLFSVVAPPSFDGGRRCDLPGEGAC